MTMPPSEPYIGPERRESDVKLESALKEVRHLYGSVEELAVAVSKSVPRDEIEAREKENTLRVKQFEQQSRLIIFGLAALFAIQFLVTIVAVRHLDHSINDGHTSVLENQRVQQCLDTIPEATRVASPAQVLIQCRQTVSAGQD